MSIDEEFLDGDDDDVFAPSASSDTQSQSSYTVNNKGVPGYLRNALERYIRENPEVESSFQNFHDPTLLSQFISIFTLFNDCLSTFAPARPKLHWSHLRAVIEVLDNQHEGLIQRLTEAYDLECKLQRLYSNYITVSQLHEAIVNAEAAATEISDYMIEYLTTLAGIYTYSIDKSKVQYADACGLAGIPTDQNIVEFGIKSEGDFAYASTNTSSSLAVHYKYGDVSSVNTIQEESFRATFIRFLVPIIFADEKLAQELLHNYVQGVK